MLEELQSLSEGNKKRVLVIATVIIMVIIIGVWATYFNSIVMGSADQATVPAVSTVATATVPTVPAATSAQANGPSLWQNIKDGFGSIANVFKKPSQYTIQPQNTQ